MGGRGSSMKGVPRAWEAAQERPQQPHRQCPRFRQHRQFKQHPSKQHRQFKQHPSRQARPPVQTASAT